MFAALILSVLAQTPDCPVYDRCIIDAQTNLDATCNLVAQKNATWYQQCLCYYNVEKGKCFVQCPNNQQVQTEGLAFQPVITSTCTAAGFTNPNALPPAPWYSALPNLPKPTSAATASTSPSSTSNPKSNGAASWGVGALLGVLALF